MELSSSNIKKILIFPKTEPCTSQAKPPQKTKKRSTRKNIHSKNIPYISGNGTF